MLKSINDSTRKQLEAFCLKISADEAYDDSICKELYAHLEDRFLGYLNSEIALSDQDAFILVKEHFGKPEEVRALLHQVHEEQYLYSMGRRVTAALTAFFLVGFFTTFLQMLVGFASQILGDWVIPIESGVYTCIELLLAPYLLYLFFLNWKKKVKHNEPTWFMTMRTRGILLVFLGSIAGNTLLPYYANWVQHTVPNPFSSERTLLITLGLFNLFISGAIWMWFFDQPPRVRFILRRALSTWAVFFCYITLLDNNFFYGQSVQQSILNASMLILLGYATALVSLCLYRSTCWIRRRAYLG